ncbi:MAG: leucine-rich repeat domain-containing protein [Hormoscilla sp. GM7CHS1pb]|nr:leucine-rich repeat domain-containing protein [Hormoscilla sp. GM7CHS1pb]
MTKLRLHNNGLTGTIPTELGELTNLQTLGLSKNNLTGTIPLSWAI